MSENVHVQTAIFQTVEAVRIMRGAVAEGDLNAKREQWGDALAEMERTLDAAAKELATSTVVKTLPSDFRTAEELDAHLRAKGVRTVVTKFADPGGTVQVIAELSVEPFRLDAFGPTASHAFDNLLTKLG
jgi:hypothetical protein